MAQPPRSSNTGGWLPYAGLALSFAGIIYQGGALTQQVKQNESRIAKLEAQNTETAKTIQEMDIRGVRTEQKLDFLVLQAQDEEHGAGKGKGD